MQKIIDVHIGEIKMAKRGEMLRAILGSCVGIGVIWKERSICTLAHCLLSQSPKRKYTIGARFVDQAILSTIALLKIKEDDFAKVRAVIVGGGNMTNFQATNHIEQVGISNYRLALNMMKDKGFKIEYTENGGNEGRKIMIDSSEFTYKVEQIPRIAQI